MYNSEFFYDIAEKRKNALENQLEKEDFERKYALEVLGNAKKLKNDLLNCRITTKERQYFKEKKLNKLDKC